MRHNLILFFFRILPKGFISRIFGYLARIPMPSFFMRPFVNLYCSFYKVNREEILFPDSGFKSMDQFFTRRLKKGVHKIDRSKNAVVSPVDASVSSFGNIVKDRIIHAKGIDYTVADLVPSMTAEEFLDGSFITLYLSPADYHRIHSPLDGRITGYYHIPGKLFPVQEIMVNGIEKLFSKNERILSYIKAGKGLAAVCKIGAMNVGRISLAYSDIEANRFFRKKKEVLYSGKMPDIKKGDELGIFHLGSTIILLFQKKMVKFERIRIGQKVRVGQRIASLN